MIPQPYIDTAIAALDAAGKITRRYFRSDIGVDIKPDQSPVTIADRETEHAMRSLILEHHPDHGFFGEETGDQTSDQEWRWIIDPIDGTKSFTTGRPTFGTLIALLHGDRPVLGMIDHVILGERWIGVDGQQTLHNGVPCEVSRASSLSAATLYCTTMDMFDRDSVGAFERLSTACRFRVFGGDCYSYGLLSSGFTDIVCEADLKPYDYLALVPVIEGAGGIISDWQGAKLSLESGDRVLASASRELHQAALAHLL